MFKAILISALFLILIFASAYFSIRKNERLNNLQKKLQPSYSVLTVKNCEDSIEGIIRSIAWKMKIQTTLFPELIIIDMGSEDNTFSIMQKLSKEYLFIHPMQKSEYINFIHQLS